MTNIYKPLLFNIYMETKFNFMLVGMFILGIVFTLVISEDINPTITGEISGKQNPKFLHFTILPISYSFDKENQCYGIKLNQVRESFDILEKETNGIMIFNESKYDGDINISCMLYEDIEGGSAGIGGSEFYEGERKILKGFVELYEIGEDYVDCESYPNTALHEILHVLGFDHINNKESIMYPGDDEYALDEKEYCQKIDKKIVECLKNIYSNGQNGSSCNGLPFLY